MALLERKPKQATCQGQRNNVFENVFEIHTVKVRTKSKKDEKENQYVSISVSFSSFLLSSGSSTQLNLHKLIIPVGKNDGWLIGFCFFRRHHGVGDNDDNVANLRFSCCGSIQAYDT